MISIRLAPRALVGALLAAAALAAPATATPVSVKLRVEGAHQTTFEEGVTTDGHTVTTASGGTHKCDGTNGGVNPTPGPSATAALDDGSMLGHFGWDGTYDSGFDDYLVSRIGPDTQTSSQFWALLVDSQFSQVGGCQQRVHEGDEVLWAFDGFSKQHALRLAGPGAATIGQPVSVHVTDGQNGSAIAGANVRGSLTGPDGRATLAFPQAGIYRLKAERSDSIRSNALVLCVDPAGADPCTSSDHVAPVILLNLPGRFASQGSRSRTIVVSWQGLDRTGSGVKSYTLQVRRVANGARHAANGWRTVVRRTALTSAHFRGGSGRAYEFRIRAFDRAGNQSSFDAGRVIIPVDDRDRRLFRFSHGWRRLHRRGAWGRQVMRSRRRGASARFRFRGRRVALIGRRLSRGGRLKVRVGGRVRVLRLRGRPRFRRVLFLSHGMRRGRHTLRLRAVGRGPVEIDAVAPIP
ncbi:MAG: hypothetical protein ABR581_00685 [Thermoleophilaceae bacterium]